MSRCHLKVDEDQVRQVHLAMAPKVLPVRSPLMVSVFSMLTNSLFTSLLVSI